MKTLWSCCIALTLLPCALWGQDSTTNAKLDTVIMYQKQMSNQQQKIYEEAVAYKEPLKDKRFGIELNPAYILLASARSYLVLSGGFSFFDADRHAELACPFFYQSGTSNTSGGYQLTLWNQDLMYRRFLGQHQDGFYLQGGFRFTHIRGEEDRGLSFLGISLISSPSNTLITTDKLGAMFGIGYRYFSSSGFYWGTSIEVGSYFSADERDIRGVTLDDTKLIFDVEILKFGYAF